MGTQKSKRSDKWGEDESSFYWDIHRQGREGCNALYVGLGP